MAAKRQATHSAKTIVKVSKRPVATQVSHERYPQWKVDLFRVGISERERQISGRAVRAPGA